MGTTPRQAYTRCVSNLPYLDVVWRLQSVAPFLFTSHGNAMAHTGAQPMRRAGLPRLLAAFAALLGCAAPGYGSDDSAAVSFVNDVAPVLTKAGCNAGGCHGKSTGQAGFKLSVLGSDPKADYTAIATAESSRRIQPAAPQQSLLLLKAAAPHPPRWRHSLAPRNPINTACC